MQQIDRQEKLKFPGKQPQKETELLIAKRAQAQTYLQ